uniref:Uncharacterized protein n=1 Tax=Meloidogyne enterolobii TaxID=390850 RepID=A0A6V7TP21_MELEN|nr:unnamed protein product [Meloidogyne enterolobii]
MINGYGNDLKCLSYREGNIFIQEKKNFFKDDEILGPVIVEPVFGAVMDWLESTSDLLVFLLIVIIMKHLKKRLISLCTTILLGFREFTAQLNM